MKNTNQSGFTLIELLVVISIIGLLSTMAIMYLGSARERSRDAKRVADIKNLSNIIELDKTNFIDSAAIIGCEAQYALTTLCTGDELTSQADNFIDPSESVIPCTDVSDAPCAYSISAGGGFADASYGDYQICTYLENGSGDFGKGLLRINAGGLMTAGCE